MDGRDDAWAVLGLDPGADRAAVRRAFRAVARGTHPDHGGDPEAFRRAKAACEAALLAAPPEPAPSRRGANPYAGFLAGLDAAARLRVTPAPPPGRADRAVRPAPPARVPPSPPPSAARFASVLAEALAAA